MTQIDELLTAFRTDQPGPSPDAIETVYAQAVRATTRRVWRRPRAVVPLAAAAAAAAGLALFWPGPAGPGLLEQAAAAVAPSGRIVHITVTASDQHRFGQGEWEQSGEPVTMHDFALFDGDVLVQMRRFISDGPLDKAPSDEDSAVEVNPDGGYAWTSWSNGELERSEELPPDVPVESLTLPGLLRSLYLNGSLEEVGRDQDGIRLRGTKKGCANDPSFSEVVVDPTTFLPRSAVSGDCAGSGGPDEPVSNRQVWTVVAVETLPDAPENRLLLEVGDWPVKG